MEQPKYKRANSVGPLGLKQRRPWYHWLDWLEVAEFVLVGGGIAVGMIIGPVLVAKRLFVADHQVAALTLIVAWGFCVAVLIRDACRRSLSMFGRIILLVWFFASVLANILLFVVL